MLSWKLGGIWILLFWCWWRSGGALEGRNKKQDYSAISEKLSINWWGQKTSGENQLRNDKTQQTAMIDVLRTVEIEKKSGRKPHSLLSYKRLLLCTLQTSLAFKARTMVDSFTGFTALHTVSVLYQQPQVKCNLRRQLECTSNIRTYVQPITSIAYPLRLRDSYA